MRFARQFFLGALVVPLLFATCVMAQDRDANDPLQVVANSGRKKNHKPKKKANAAEVADNDGETSVAAASATSSPGASYDNRARKHYSVMAEMGFTELPEFGFGLKAAMIEKPSLMYEAGYFHANFELFGIRYTSSIISARMKWFPGNSFYLTGGVAYRQLEGEVKEFLFGNDTLSRFNNSSLMADFALGNHWQMDSFTIGCDWIGFFVPLVKLSETAEEKVAADGSTNDANDFKKRAKDVTTELLRFYIGWSF